MPGEAGVWRTGRTVGTTMEPVVTLGGAVWVFCSLGRGWSGRPGQGGLRDAAAGRKQEAGSEGLPEGTGVGNRGPCTWDRTGFPEGLLDSEPETQPPSAPGPRQTHSCLGQPRVFEPGQLESLHFTLIIPSTPPPHALLKCGRR